MKPDGATAGARDVSPGSFCVCVPARNEAERLPVLLAALADQNIEDRVRVAIGVNNTTDSSIAVIEDLRRVHALRLDIQVDNHVFPPSLAHAGSARGRVMDLGLRLIDQSSSGVLLTTDADTRPPKNWIAENLRAIRNGADIVGGYLVLDEAEDLPPMVKAYSDLWHRYWEKVRAIEDAIDPCPWDPPPRHGDHTGASLALTASIYRSAGGVPAIALGEDRALVQAAIAAGGRLVHPMSVWTRVSPRRNGRAVGGMAQVMTALHEAVETGQVVMAPSLDHWHRRAAWRREMRDKSVPAAMIVEAESRLPSMPADVALADIVKAP
jgi:cellulose synthase/poly-beta-1,6-N-acetylglucosamine synthase-like glycosyltransferase